MQNRPSSQAAGAPDSAVAAAGALAAAAAEPASPAPACPADLWKEFDAGRALGRAGSDKLAGALLLAVTLAARARVGLHETAREVRWGAALAVGWCTVPLRLLRSSSTTCPIRSPPAAHLPPPQELHSAGVLAAAIAVMLCSEELAAAGWLRLRECLVLAAKLLSATAPLFECNAVQLLKVGGCAAWLAGRALLRAMHVVVQAAAAAAVPRH